MLWCALHFPALALDLLRQGSIDPLPPLAVIEGSAQRPAIHLCNRAARRMGVRPGQKLASARTLCPELLSRPRDLKSETQALQHLAAACYAWSSRVCLGLPLPGERNSKADPAHPPRAELVLEIAASERLLGPGSELIQALCQRIRELGYSVRSACAPTARAALVLARARISTPVLDHPGLVRALAPLPLTYTELDTKVQALLCNSGLREIGAVLRLPRPELTRRIGPQAMAYLDVLLGKRAEAPAAWTPPARFEQHIELPAEVQHSQGLQFPLKRLLMQLDAFLTGQDASVQQIVMHLGHAGVATTRIPVGLLRPQRGLDLLFPLCRERLERESLRAAVRSFGIEATQVQRYEARAADLFERSDMPGDGLDALLERLRARLGDEAVHGLGSVAEHRPEYSWQPLPVPVCHSAVARSHRPIWLLREPLPADPAQLSFLSGPERIESGWWDGKECRRDYYLACDQHGACCWVFHQARPAPGWFVHGWFG